MIDKIKKLLCKDFLALPYDNSSNDILGLLTGKYVDLAGELKANKIRPEICDAVKENGEAVCQAIKAYLSGNIPGAISSIGAMMDRIKDSIRLVSEFYKDYSVTVYYRMRTGDKTEDNSLTKREGFLHIPFEMRYKVANFRYSIAGYPCVYLGATTYTCFEELRRPDQTKIHVAKIEIPEDYRLITIGLLPYEVKDILIREGIKEEILIAYLEMLPLIMASSVKVPKDKRDKPFKVEYIVPQMVMQWLITSNFEFDGILYFSTATPTHSKRNHKLYQNVVLPVREIKDKGYCKKLSKDLEISEALSVDNVLSKLGETNLLSEGYPVSNYNRSGLIEVGENESIHYSDSGFAYVEDELDKSKLKTLT